MCICVSVYAYRHVGMYAYMQLCICVYIYIYIYTYYIYIYTYIHIWISVHIYIYEYIQVYIHIDIITDIAYMYICMYLCMYLCMYIFICLYIYVCILQHHIDNAHMRQALPNGVGCHWKTTYPEAISLNHQSPPRQERTREKRNTQNAPRALSFSLCVVHMCASLTLSLYIYIYMYGILYTLSLCTYIYMRVAFYSCSAVLTELPLPGTLPGTPPLFLPGTFRDCGFLEGLFYCNTFLFKSKRKSVSAS